MVTEVIGLLEGDGHCVAERKKQHGYRSDWSIGRRWHCVAERKKQHGYRSDWFIGRRWALCS